MKDRNPAARRERWGKALSTMYTLDPVKDRAILEAPMIAARPRRKRFASPIVRFGIVLAVAIGLLRGLNDYGPNVGEWVAIRSAAYRLTGPNESAWEDAATDLAGRGDKGVTYLRRALKDTRPGVRQAALGGLARATGDTKLLLDDLMNGLIDTDASVRAVAVQALGRYGVARPDGKAKSAETFAVVLQGLITALRDGDSAIRTDATESLAMIGPAAGLATEDLTNALKDPDRTLRIAAARALLKVDRRDNPDAIRTLTAALQDEDAMTDDMAALTPLLDVGSPAASAAVPTLVKMLKSEAAPDHHRALEMLRRIGPPAAPALPALKNYAEMLAEVGEPDPGPYAAMRRGRAGMMPWGSRFTTTTPMPPNVEDSFSLRYQTAMTAITIEGKASPWTITTLVNVVADPKADPFSRGAAAREVARHDKAALAKAVPKLVRQIINQPDPNLRRMDVDLLMQIDPKSLEKAMMPEDDDPNP